MSIPVRALFFASYRDLVGASELLVEVGEPATVADLVRTLRQRGGGFGALPEAPAIALNRRYARPDAALCPGDEVAFIPPVAGG